MRNPQAFCKSSDLSTEKILCILSHVQQTKLEKFLILSSLSTNTNHQWKRQLCFPERCWLPILILMRTPSVWWHSSCSRIGNHKDKQIRWGLRITFPALGIYADWINFQSTWVQQHLGQHKEEVRMMNWETMVIRGQLGSVAAMVYRSRR